MRKEQSARRIVTNTFGGNLSKPSLDGNSCIVRSTLYYILPPKVYVVSNQSVLNRLPTDDSARRVIDRIVPSEALGMDNGFRL